MRLRPTIASLLPTLSAGLLLHHATAYAESDDEAEEDSDRGGNKVEEDVEAAKEKRNAPSNSFSKDRFFIDKLDTADTDEKTLLQGNFTSSTFLYRESGGALADDTMTPVNVNSPFSRFFTDLRAQLDARHIKGGRWDFRLDARGRLVQGGGAVTPNPNTPEPRANIQSGARGRNELDLREAWLVRSGERTDVFIGRQFITDLAATRIDGIRLDYAMSRKITLLGYAGALPYRGSRSIGTDYPNQFSAERTPLGKTPPIGAGFGAAYRTPRSYGALGSVLAIPLKGASPRISVTSNGYWRNGKIDLYHFALVDLFKKFSLTNVSAGANYKPSPRMRLTAGFHRMDVDTLAIQASGYFADPATAGINEIALRSVASNQLRAGLSVGLGRNQRFEVSMSGGYRFRPGFTIADADNNVVATLDAQSGLEVTAGVADRRSLKGFRFGADVSRFFGVGDVAFSRSTSLSLRGTAAREFKQGRGMVELEAGYLSARDDNGGVTCGGTIDTCYGASKVSVKQGGGTVYYRLKPAWFLMGNMFLSMQSGQTAGKAADPTLVSTSGFLRIGYRY